MSAQAVLPRRRALALVVLPSAVTLVVELMVVRLVAPYVGLTLETYSAAIGVALAGISVGAWLGGRIADRSNPERLLAPILIAAALLVWLARPLALTLGPSFTGTGTAGALALVAISAALPIVALSTVPPITVKLSLARLAETGTVVGGLSAAGTLGALAGTFLTGFVLLGRFSTTTILLVSGLAVAALGALCVSWFRGGRTGLPVLGLLAVVVLSGLLAVDGSCERETKYFCARIHTEGPIRNLILDDGNHAAVDMRDPARLVPDYARRVGAVLRAVAPPGTTIDALVIGGGGFVLPRHVTQTRPGSRVTVLELDAAVPEIARERLALTPSADQTIRIGDARTSIKEEPSGKYDVVIGDAFSAHTVPWHLTTREFIEEVRRVLKPSGTYALNVIDGRSLRLLRAELRTLRAVFPHVVMSAQPGWIGRVIGANWIPIASGVPLRLRAEDRSSAQTVMGEQEVARLAGTGFVLTDDFAPVDQLLSRVALAG